MTKIGKKIQQAKADGRVTKPEVDGLIKQANANKVVSKAEKKELTKLLKTSGDQFDTEARSTLATFLGETPPSPPTTLPEAKIQFNADWEEPIAGALVAGGKLTFEYDPNRAPLRNTHNGYPAWGVEAFIRLNPSGEVIQAKAIDFESRNGQPTSTPKSIPVSVAIPPGTTEVEMWFRNWTGASSPVEQYDSNFGSNYRFAVKPGNS